MPVNRPQPEDRYPAKTPSGVRAITDASMFRETLASFEGKKPADRVTRMPYCPPLRASAAFRSMPRPSGVIGSAFICIDTCSAATEAMTMMLPERCGMKHDWPQTGSMRKTLVALSVHDLVSRRRANALRPAPSQLVPHC